MEVGRAVAGREERRPESALWRPIRLDGEVKETVSRLAANQA